VTLTEAQLKQAIAVAYARGASFTDLVHIAKLDPATDFVGGDLRGADLRDQDLTGYNFTKANLSGADTRGANLSDTVGLATAQLSGMAADGDTRLPPNTHCPGTMIPIQPGQFQRGRPLTESMWETIPKEFRGWELPRRKVTISYTLLLGRYPVTVGEFRRFVEDTGYEIPSGAYSLLPGKGWTNAERFNWQDPGFEQTPDHPVTCVNFQDAEAYSDWLSVKTGHRYRLPSESEWEYACRAGTTTARFWGNRREGARRFANVADLSLARKFDVKPDSGRFFQHDDGYPFTSPVGAFAPNPWGLYDMLGNVWEWCADAWHDSYDGAPDDGSARTTTGSVRLRVLRGGSWNYIPWLVRSGSRSWVNGRSTNTGFRLARTL
jgi:formylglycine-generating enzyme